jgi:hypothetical protein
MGGLSHIPSPGRTLDGTYGAEYASDGRRCRSADPVVTVVGPLTQWVPPGGRADSTPHAPSPGRSPGTAPAAPGTYPVVAVVGPLPSPGDAPKHGGTATGAPITPRAPLCCHIPAGQHHNHGIISFHARYSSNKTKILHDHGSELLGRRTNQALGTDGAPPQRRQVTGIALWRVQRSTMLAPVPGEPPKRLTGREKYGPTSPHDVSRPRLALTWTRRRNSRDGGWRRTG